MRRIVTVVIAALMLTAAGAMPAFAEAHEFRGHIDTTATPVISGPVSIEGSGLISGLGVTTMSGAEIVDPTDRTITGSATFTAASGDTLTFAWTHVPTAGAPPTVSFDGSMTVIAGTGRLSARSGTVGFNGGFSFTTSHGWFDVTGALDA